MSPELTITETRPIKAPAGLLGATLLFWGWQTGFLIIGVALAVVLEGVRRVSARWDLSDDDFHRIWNFNTVLMLAAMMLALSANEGPGGFSGLLQGPALAVGAKVGF